MKKYLFVLFFVITVFALCCCKPEKVTYSPSGTAEIRIGVMLSLSGGGYSTGESSLVSLQLAQQDVMDYLHSMGIHREVVLEMVDTKTDTAEALKQLKLLYNKGIRIVIGPYASAEVLAIKPFADLHGILVVSPSSVAVSLALPDDNIFRFVSSDVIQGKAMTKMLTEDNIRVIVPVVRDDVWGSDLFNSTSHDFMNAGGMVHAPVFYPAQTTDFTPFLARLDSNVSAELKNFDSLEIAVYMLTLSEGAEFLHGAQASKSLGKVRWYGSSAFAENVSVLTDTIAGRFAWSHGLPCPIFGLDESARYKWQPLSARIQAKTGRAPDSYAFTAYDALWVSVLTSLRADASTALSQFKQVFMLEAANYFGVTGNTVLDANGDRAFGNYDFWSVKRGENGYFWGRVALYNSATGALTRFP